jgi:hypothetical protein
MSKKQIIEIEDVGGRFAALYAASSKSARAHLADAVRKSVFALEHRMTARSPVGPDAPHIKENITSKSRGMFGQAGLIDAGQPAAPGSTASLADVGLYNEYKPNDQPFMRPSAEAETKDHVRRCTDAIRQMERDLSGGGGLL